MSLTEAEVEIANQALAGIGSKRFTLAVQTGNEGVMANLHYEQTRDALLRSFEWPFASDRATLAQDTKAPDFDWDHQYKLPEDFLRLKSFCGESITSRVGNRWTIEGKKILTSDDEADIEYIKKVTDPDDFDPLFTEVFILKLSLKFLPSLAGTKTSDLRDRLNGELKDLLSRVRTICRQEVNVSGRSDWNMARYSGTV